MKPSFALNLSHDGLSLLHRAAGGWHIVGEVALDAPDMVEKLGYLHKTASELASGQLACKLVIPNSQILYVKVDALGATDARREEMIRRALKGATPYAVADLVFDWHDAGNGMARVAAVARDTLHEAEVFATEHRFNPVSFVAIPEAGDFEGEPFFGQTALSDALLAGGETVERDREAIHIVAVTRPATAEITDQPDTDVELATDDAAVSGPEKTPDWQKVSASLLARHGTGFDVRTAETPSGEGAETGDTEVGDETTDGNDDTADAGEDLAVPVQSKAKPEPRKAAAGVKPDDPDDLDDLDKPTEADAKAAAEKPGNDGVAGDNGTDSDRDANTGSGSDVLPAGDQQRDADADNLPPPPRDPLSFASRRSDAADTANGPTPGRIEPRFMLYADKVKPAAKPVVQTTTAPAGKPAARVGAAPAKPEITSLSVTAPTVAGETAPPTRKQPNSEARKKNGGRKKRARAQPPVSTPTPTPKLPSQTPKPKAAAAVKPKAAAPMVPAGRADTPAKQPAPERTDERAMTIFGARNSVKVGGKPRHLGLVLTLGLIVLIALAALVSGFFIDTPISVSRLWGGLTGGGEKIVSTPISPTPDTSPATIDAAIPEAITGPGTAPDSAAPESTTPQSQSALANAPAKLPPPVDTAPAVTSQTTPQSAAPATVAGVPSVDIGAARDPALLATTATGEPGLPPVGETPRRGTAPAQPLPADTGERASGTTELASLPAADGLGDGLPPLTDVELAESEPLLGQMTIDQADRIYQQIGVWSMAPITPVDLDRDRIDNLYVASIDRRVVGYDAIALPDVVAGPRDRAMAPLVPPAPLGTTYDRDARGFVRATPDGALTPAGVLVIAGKPPVVPIARPGTAPPVAARPDTATQAELTSARPIARPPNLIEQDQRARLGGLSRQELGGIRPVARPASAQSQVSGPDLAATDLAVARSRRPLARPGGMAKAVQRALAAALANGTAGGTDSSGGIATAAAARTPTIPSNASVAREATLENAISLSRVNLIGVYGASTDRRALIRLKSGRYIKVQVGDRLDGGKVAAIGERKLQYVKRGRTITLEIAS